MHPGTVRQIQWLDPFNRDRRRDYRWLRGRLLYIMLLLPY